MSKPSLPRRMLSGVWNAITRIRMALANILFLSVLALILYLLFAGDGPQPMPARAALLLNPAGTIVDQKANIDPFSALVDDANPISGEVLLRDVLDAIHYAKDDPAINALVMELDQMMSVGISKTQEISRALDGFRASGKPLIAVGDYYTQDQYLLASQADKIIMHPLGGVAIEGFSSYRNYYRDALEKLAVTMHVFKAGDHKSIAEPYLRSDMSEGERRITQRWLQQLWDQYTSAVENRRHLSAGALDSYVNNYAVNVAAQGGDLARTARSAKLVDELMQRPESNDYLVSVVGASDEDGRYQSVPFDRYVTHKRPLALPKVLGKRIAVVSAVGNILPGEQPPGTIGGDSLAQLLHDTAAESDVAAIVLRIDSGGGSVFASEVIRQQLLKIKRQGMPVVVSMGAVAASGGYYIAAEADQIWATPATITGSIGVFAAFPTVEQLLERVGVTTDGVGTTDLAGAFRIDRPLNEQVAATLTSSVEFTYREFVGLVAKGRDMTPAAVDKVAQGRVWSAIDAKERGLVDALGHLEDAVAAAAKLAGLSTYKVDYVRPPLSAQDMLLERLLQRSVRIPMVADTLKNLSAARMLQPLGAAVRALEALQDPGHLYMQCQGCSLTQ